MNVFQKIFIFMLGFTGIFYLIHTNEYYNSKILLADLGGIPGLYSPIGLMFSILAAFIIQKEWENWNNLVDAVKDEVDSLEELLLWSEHVGNTTGRKVKQLIADYCGVVIREGWRASEHGERSEAAEAVLYSLRGTLFEASQRHLEQHQDAATSLALFANILKHRRDRLHFSSRHMPDVLRYILIFSMTLLVSLSLLFGIKNVWLNYIFTASIATLAYAVYTVITDLDYPLRPGGWHLTTKDYEDLLQRMKI